MGVWWRVGNIKLLKHKNIKAFEFVDESHKDDVG
jgi:hypothetical protein